MTIAIVPPTDKALPCTGADINDTPLWRMFLSIEPTAHEQAKALCLECPALLWCTKDTANALHGLYGSGVHGTWAGHLYIEGRRVTKAVSVGECPVCGVGNGQPCISKRGKKVSQPHAARRAGLPKCRTCDGQFNPLTTGRTRYCSQECSTTGRRQQHKASSIKKQKGRSTAFNCIECGALTGGTRCQRCSAARASRISYGREIA